MAPVGAAVALPSLLLLLPLLVYLRCNQQTQHVPNPSIHM